MAACCRNSRPAFIAAGSRGASTPTTSLSAASSTAARMRWSRVACSRATSRSILSPELAQTIDPADPAAGSRRTCRPNLVDRVRARVASAGLALNDGEFARCWLTVWPRAAEDEAPRREISPRRARQRFTTELGRGYLRELSIDELPGSDDAGDDCDHAVAVRGARHARSISWRPLRLSEEHAVSGQRRAAARSSRSSGRSAARSTRASAFIPARASRPKTTR